MDNVGFRMDTDLPGQNFVMKARPGMNATEWLGDMRDLLRYIEEAANELPDCWAAKLGLSRDEVLALYEPVVCGAMAPGNTVSVRAKLTDAGAKRLIAAAASVGMHVYVPPSAVR